MLIRTLREEMTCVKFPTAKKIEQPPDSGPDEGKKMSTTERGRREGKTRTFFPLGGRKPPTYSQVQVQARRYSCTYNMRTDYLYMDPTRHIFLL